MAKHIYVSSVIAGGATGDQSYTTRQTGNITALTASTVYDTLEEAVVGASPTDGDFIYCADNHDSSYLGDNTDLTISSGDYTGQGLKIISVLNTAIEEYSPGASDVKTGGYDTILNYNVLMKGVSIQSGDDTLRMTTSGSMIVLEDMTVSSAGSGDIAINPSADGVRISMKNIILGCGSVNGEYISATNGCKITWNGGSTTGVVPGDLFSSFGGNGGATALLNGVDLSAFTGNILPVLTAGLSDVSLLRMKDCLLNSSATIPTAGTTLTQRHHRFEMFNCDNGTDDAYHRFTIMDGTGTAKNIDSVYVTANPGFNEDTDKSSIKVTTTALCGHANPFVFELPARYADLSDVGVTDKISINIVTDFSITDTEIAFFLTYPDGTTKVQANWLSSGKTVGAGNLGTDPMAAGTALNTTGALAAGDWTGEPASPIFYKVELDTVNDAGSACVPTVRIEVYKASIAGTTGSYLYIDPVLAVGT